MSVMVEEAPVWAGASIPSPPIRQTSRSTMDQFKERNCVLFSIQAENLTARLLCDSWAHAIPRDTHLGEIVGVNTSPHIHHYYHSTVNADRLALALSTDKALLTRLRKHVVIALRLTDTMTPSPELHSRESSADPDLKRSLGRLNYLRSLPDGWLGEDSFGASEAAGVDAEQLLRRIRQEVPSGPLPVLGLDTDGTIVMSWSRGDLAGSMTIYGDGTFSYFVRRNAASVKNIEAMIDQPLAKDLKDLLAA